MTDAPILGRTVLYRSKTGNYTIPAIVNCTVDSIDLEGVRLEHVPPLSSETHVHLTVFTPGIPGTTRTGQSDPHLPHVSGCYQEWDIPLDDTGQAPGSWTYMPAMNGGGE